MKFFIDTEFIEAGRFRPIQLLSIGIVCEDGRELYLEHRDAVTSDAGQWVCDNVLPHLQGPRLPMSEIASRIRQFIGLGTPEFWGYYADYDWVVFCQIFGAMIDLPNGWPMYCRDIKQLCDSLGNPELPKQKSSEHHALHDARWNKTAYEFLVGRCAMSDGKQAVGAKHYPVANRDHSDAWITCSCGWGSFGDNGEDWLEHAAQIARNSAEGHSAAEPRKDSTMVHPEEPTSLERLRELVGKMEVMTTDGDTAQLTGDDIGDIYSRLLWAGGGKV